MIINNSFQNESRASAFFDKLKTRNSLWFLFAPFSDGYDCYNNQFHELKCENKIDNVKKIKLKIRQWKHRSKKNAVFYRDVDDYGNSEKT